MRKGKCWYSTDGKPFATLAELQRVELVSILEKLDLHKGAELGSADEQTETQIRIILSNHIIANAEPIVNLLTLKDSSHPKARTASGAAPKKRGRKPAAEPAAQAALPGTNTV